MNTITFNAFSFLRPKLKSRNIAHVNAKLDLPEGTTARGLIARLGLQEAEVEAVFVNGRVVSMDAALQDNDRVAFVPPGMPGPYRVLLGMVKP